MVLNELVEDFLSHVCNVLLALTASAALTRALNV